MTLVNLFHPLLMTDADQKKPTRTAVLEELRSTSQSDVFKVQIFSASNATTFKLSVFFVVECISLTNRRHDVELISVIHFSCQQSLQNA